MPDHNNPRRQYLAAKLAAHTATDAERDEAIGTILLSLWSEEDIEQTIEKKHNTLCTDKCPLKHPNGAALPASTQASFKEKLIMELLRLIGLTIVIIGALVGATRILGDLPK